MASLHNYRNGHKPSFMDGIGTKIKHVSQFIGAAKGLYDIGRSIYTTGRTLAPIVGALL